MDPALTYHVRGGKVAVKRSEVRILKVEAHLPMLEKALGCSQTIRGQDTERMAEASARERGAGLQSNDPRSGY